MGSWATALAAMAPMAPMAMGGRLWSGDGGSWALGALTTLW